MGSRISRPLARVPGFLREPARKSSDEAEGARRDQCATIQASAPLNFR
jgi:hypothetical protein